MKRLSPKTPAQHVLHAVMLVMRTVAAEMRRVRSPIAPAQFGLLMKLSICPCTMSDLARHQEVTLPTVSKSVDMLVRRGWVERWPSTWDRRQTMVRLSRGGRRVLAEAGKHAERQVARTLSRLSSSQRAELVDAMALLSKVLEEPGEPVCEP